MPGLVLLGAGLPLVGYLGLLVWIARGAHVRLRWPVAAFALVWGAGIAAPVAGLVNELVQVRLRPGGWWLTATGVPIIEEAAKAGVLLALVAVWPTETRGLRAGIVAGGLIGLGFGFTENVGYFLLARVAEGPAGLVRAVAVRGLLEGAVHPVFTASTGAGLGVERATARGRGRLRPTVVGFGAAVAQHGLWNGVASRAVNDILCGGVGPSGVCNGSPAPSRLFAVPLIVAAALAPGVVTLFTLARRAEPSADGADLQDEGH